MPPLRRFLASAAVALTVAAAVSPATGAHAAGTPADLTLTGVGAGHGVGLSQFGAQVRAKQGASAEAILSHYYPGTVLTNRPSRPVRVLISRWDGRTSCTATPESGEPCLSVVAEPGQRFVNTVSGGTVTPPTQIAGRPVTALAVGSGSVGLKMWAKAGSWQVLEGGAQFTGPIDITSADGVQTGVFGSTRKDYRGALRAVRASASTIQRINVVSMDDYLRGVVPLEMPASWPDSALQAQGVAAATFAADFMRRYPSRGYDLCDTTSCQVYGGVGAEHSNSDAVLAASPLRSKVLTSGGVPITAYFSSSNGGHSVKGEHAYLPARADSADPNNRWTRTVTGTCLAGKYPGRGSFTGLTVLARDGRGQWGGRVTRLRLNFTGGSVTVEPKASPVGTDSAVRQAFSGCGGSGGLSSSMFTVTGDTGVPTTPPQPAPNQPGVLSPGTTLTSGQSVSSASGQHTLTVGDGWRLTSRSCPDMTRQGTGTGRLMMQDDGNLVFYGSSVWHTRTAGNPGAYAVLQDDANLVVRSATGKALWSARTVCSEMHAHDRSTGYAAKPRPATMLAGDYLTSADRATQLHMQRDGNLVLYRSGRPLWSTRTAGNAGARAIHQTDGNFVVYSSANRPLWSSRTVFPANATTLADSHVLTVLNDRVAMRSVVVNTGTGARSEKVIWRS